MDDPLALATRQIVALEEFRRMLTPQKKLATVDAQSDEAALRRGGFVFAQLQLERSQRLAIGRDAFDRVAALFDDVQDAVVVHVEAACGQAIAPTDVGLIGPAFLAVEADAAQRPGRVNR